MNDARPRIRCHPLALPLLLLACAAPREHPESFGDDFHAIDAVFRDLYASVSFGPGGGPDWEAFGTLVRPDAIFAQAQRGDTPTTYLSMEGFLQDWRDFMAGTPVGERGFTETVVRHQTTVFGNVAHSFVVFAPRIGSGDQQPAYLGVDSVQLVKDGERWWIASITTQFETDEWKVPPVFEHGSG